MYIVWTTKQKRFERKLTVMTCVYYTEMCMNRVVVRIILKSDTRNILSPRRALCARLLVTIVTVSCRGAAGSGADTQRRRGLSRARTAWRVIKPNDQCEDLIFETGIHRPIHHGQYHLLISSRVTPASSHFPLPAVRHSPGGAHSLSLR